MKKTANASLTATACGPLANKMLDQNLFGSIMGLTSRGAFMQIENDGIFFLSHEPWRGPLTINIKNPLSGLELRAPLRIHARQVHFPSINNSLHVPEKCVWEPELAQSLQSYEDQFVTLHNLAEALVTQKGPETWAVLLLVNDHSLSEGLALLSRALRTAQWDEALNALVPLMGMGRGLTPSGDDFTIGLLLALHHLKRLQPDLNLPPISFVKQVKTIASQVTTRLSASLIECAAEGMADERLMDALKGLLEGSLPFETLLAYLSEWGNSSGADALAGMATALNLQTSSR
ncbi:MAG TPA: DUF2877 domain-containing protein [Anaerolineaceae bacterium]|nr:DUF2877 domain-containing protein [Anaerolineaceae bacterium]HPN53736.1 DUF2877 domain-containing protein [Anaerolineaceae bacterium]